MLSFIQRFLLIAAFAAAANADVSLASSSLSNGLRVVESGDPRAGKIAVNITFDAGSRHDPRGRDGTAWMAMRLFCDRLSGFRCDVNPERAVFAIEVTSENHARTFEEIAAAMSVTTFESFARTRDSLIAEHESDAAKPFSGVDARLVSLAYGNTSYGHPAYAPPHRVRPADVKRFMSANYAPSHAVLAVAGAIDPDTLRRTLNTTLGRVPARGNREKCHPLNLKATSERRVTIRDEAANTSQIAMAYPNVPAAHPDWYAINILADILGQGPQSRMQTALVDVKLAAAFGEGESESACAASLLRLRARAADEVSPAQIEEVIDRELDRLARELVSDAELQRAHQQELDYAREQSSTPENLANAMGRATLFYGDPETLKRDAQRMAAVTAEDVRRVVQTYLRRANRVVVVSTPR